MSDIFREIDEELRRDNLLKLWKRHSRSIVIGVAVVLAIVAGIVVWRQHLAEQRLAQSTRYFGALSLVAANKNADAARIFADIERTGGGYAELSRFEQAELKAKAGDHTSAAAIYDSIVKSSGDPVFGQLALLLSVMHAPANADPKWMVARLAPLTASGNPWRPTALELTGAADLKAGNKAAALAIYKQLSDDAAAPEGLRARAAEMAAALSP